MHLSCTCVSLVGMFGSMFTGQCVPEYSCVQVYVCVCTCVYLSTGIGGAVEFQGQKEQKGTKDQMCFVSKGAGVDGTGWDQSTPGCAGGEEAAGTSPLNMTRPLATG